MCRLAQIEFREETRKAEELRRELVEQRREEKYRKHYQICQQVIFYIDDFIFHVRGANYYMTMAASGPNTEILEFDRSISGRIFPLLSV